MIERFVKKIKELNKAPWLLYLLLWLLGVAGLGFLLRSLLDNIGSLFSGGGWNWRLSLLLQPSTYIAGVLVMVFLWAIFWVGTNRSGSSWNSTGFFGKGKGYAVEDSPLENSRFLTDAERDKYFTPFTYETATQVKNDGVPVRAVLDKKKKLQCNFMSGVHSLVIGATGSGKTTTFINPMIQLIAASKKGSSMIMTDPKGELFDLHSKFLTEQGYDVLLLDLRDTYSSSR